MLALVGRFRAFSRPRPAPPEPIISGGKRRKRWHGALLSFGAENDDPQTKEMVSRAAEFCCDQDVGVENDGGDSYAYYESAFSFLDHGGPPSSAAVESIAQAYRVGVLSHHESLATRLRDISNNERQYADGENSAIPVTGIRSHLKRLKYDDETTSKVMRMMDADRDGPYSYCFFEGGGIVSHQNGDAEENT